MKRLWIVALLVVLAGCAGKPVATVPAVVEGADQNVRAASAKALGIILAADRVVNTLSLAEGQAVADGAVPASADRLFDGLMLAYVRASDHAVWRLRQGVATWGEMSALVTPIVEEIDRLVAWVKSLGVIRTRFEALAATAKAILTDALAEVAR